MVPGSCSRAKWVSRRFVNFLTQGLLKSVQRPNPLTSQSVGICIQNVAIDDWPIPALGSRQCRGGWPAPGLCWFLSLLVIFNRPVTGRVAHCPVADFELEGSSGDLGGKRWATSTP